MFHGRFAEDENLSTTEDRTTFLGLPALSLANITPALPVNYGIGNLCNNVVRASVFVFQFAIQKFKDQDIQNYNFARCLVWM